MPEKETNTPKKSAKAAKRTEGSGSSAKEKVAAIVRTDNFKIFGIIALSLILVLCLSLGLVFGFKNCSNVEIPVIEDPFAELGSTVTSIGDSHKNTTLVGYSAETIGTVERNKPVAGEHNEGLSSKGYPTYGKSLNVTSEEKTIIIQENRKLTANGTWVDSSYRITGTYDLMDKDGYLYKKQKDADGNYLKPADDVPERLYKHTASDGLYGGNVSDTEPGIIKQVTLRPRGYSSYSVTGVYAPAGEVIKIQLSGADMDATGGITVHIGQALYNGQANNIWEQRGFNRMPVILNTMSVTKETATYDEATDTWTGYVGSFLGGPLYIRNTSKTIKATISGGVAYRHFILGYTTEAEFTELCKSSAPYFDLEVWEYGVLHSGPVSYAKNFSYNDLYKAAVLWEKVSIVTTTNGSKQGIVFIYDPFVAAGAAVAFPGRSSVNCPMDWMPQSLNYNSLVTSGSWGNFHEYHHNFQNYGMGYTGEVTNNGLNLVAYSLFTKISSARQIAGYGGSGLSGWNQYTSATWALNQVNNKAITGTNGLAVYATLLHNLGQDAFINARGRTGVNYLNRYAELTHMNFSRFAESVQDYSGIAPSALSANDYPLFVPVSSVYQTGRTYMYDGEKREITTMQPYVIPYGNSFKVDLREYKVNGSGQYERGSVVIGKGFSFSVKSVNTDGINGTFVKSGEEGVYTFTPNEELRSGKIRVTIEIFYGEVKDGVREYDGHKIDDVDLILEFQQSHETNKNVLERTIYKFDEMKYTSATEAYEAGYEGNTESETVDNNNYSQNSNTDIWLYPLRYTDDATYGQFVYTPNSVLELKGKLYFPEAGKYRIFMRGRSDCALYISRDNGKTYSLAAHIDRNDNLGTSAVFFPNNDKTYVDVEVKSEDWIYFKEVLIVEPMPNSANMVSYVGLGMNTWTVPDYTTEVQYYCMIGNSRQNLAAEATENGTRYYYPTSGNGTRHYVELDGTRYYYGDNGVAVQEDKVGAVQSETHYYTNQNGTKVEVTAEAASNVDPVPPTSANYVTAYRQSYEFQKEFESDYFYKRTYTYSYSYVESPSEVATVTGTDVEAYGDSPFINLLYEGGLPGTTGKFFAKNPKLPFEINIDMGHEITANRVDLFGELANGMSYHPTKFYILVGNSPEDVSTPFGPKWENVQSTNGKTGFSIEESVTFRYVKLVVEAWSFGNPQFRNVKFSNIIPGTATQYSPDDARFTYTGEWRVAQTSATFGHGYLGTNGSELSFEYEAKNGNGRVGIITSNKFGQNYEVYIDGNKVETEKFKEQSDDIVLRYLTPKLSDGKHQVVIKCVGEANFDSIVLY